MTIRKGLFAAWLAMCGFVLVGCTLKTNSDDDDTSDDDSSARSDDSAEDDDSASSDDDAESGGAGGAGGAGQAGSEEDNQGGSAGAPAAAQSELAQIEGAIFLSGRRPNTTGSQTGPEVDAPEFVINGGTGQYTIGIPDGAEAIVIGIEGDNGYYKIPVTTGASSQDVAITLLQSYDEATLGVLVATVDGEGDVSAWTSNTVDVVETAAGDLKVSLSFNEAEDLDLWVTDPDGLKIYYATPTGNGATLDLDSNASCSSNLGVNNENITWDGSSVLEGEYTVQVNYYDQCSAASVDYIVTVSIGNDVRTYTGSFDASDVEATHTVTTFTYNG